MRQVLLRLRNARPTTTGRRRPDDYDTKENARLRAKSRATFREIPSLL